MSMLNAIILLASFSTHADNSANQTMITDASASRQYVQASDTAFPPICDPLPDETPFCRPKPPGQNNI